MTSEHIKSYVNDYFKTDIGTKSRNRELHIYPRMVYYALCEEFTSGESGYAIAKMVGVTHATRIHALRQWKVYHGQTFFKDYTEAFLIISKFIVDNNLNDPHKKLKTIEEIQEEYKNKFLRLIDKQQRVISNIKKKCELLERSKTFNEILELSDSDIKEFEQLTKVFLKRKKRELEYQK